MRLISFFFFLLIAVNGMGQQQINWLDGEELNQKFSAEQKPVLLFFYTDWCKYCKMQENTTFQDSIVIATLNQNYYAMKVNAEQKESIQFFGREYHFNSQEELHDLAIYLGKNKGQLEFPTTVLLSRQLEPIYNTPAYLSSKDLLQLIQMSQLLEDK